MGWGGKRNTFIDVAAISSSHTQHNIADAVAINQNSLNRATGVEFAEAMKAVAPAVTPS